MQTETNTAGATERVIPNPPGGGSWTFDETSWQWKSNDPDPEQALVAAGTDAPTVTSEQEQ
jgi:hypothetical protein